MSRFRDRLPTPDRRLVLRAGLAATAAFAAVPGLTAPSDKPLKIGTGGGPLAEILNFAVAKAKEKGLEVQVVEFTDWITPNEALANGDIDANLFQHIPFMTAASKARGYKFAAVAPTYVMPVGLFSNKVKTFAEVPDGAWVAIANDPVNGARGLRLLDKAGLIKLKPGAGDDATVIDIVSNPKKLRFRELEAAQLPRSLDDVTLAQVSISFLMMSGGDPERALLADGFGDDHYALQFVTRAADKDDPRLKRFIEIYRSPEVKAFIQSKYGRFFVPVW
ncbi:MetQ/NlpA family ABC transporter substrate-binding protein [Enterovirga aerilata]|uniref:Lipoprotein n=1 Tax=Enterovirga aerilata TaxID=2730920 RepID=A0A849IGC3_9HYPH|nr:MetQ/NlpA family ABC transporter substrate-binding protein [Enterovirga sp. DB1703]NNM75245.1 MetQ/NlpA family ABC transporter substrate-binding protein [Enterovirga sp. DB1703]